MAFAACSSGNIEIVEILAKAWKGQVGGAVGVSKDGTTSSVSFYMEIGKIHKVQIHNMYMLMHTHINHSEIRD